MASVMVSRSSTALHVKVDVHGVIATCNDAASAWLEALSCQLGRRAPPVLGSLVLRAREEGVVAGRLPCADGELDVVVVASGTDCDVYGTARAVDPDPLGVTWDNPNPVLRVDREGQVLYANPAAEPLLTSWGVLTGDRLPQAWVDVLRQIAPGDRRELVSGGGFAVTVCPQADARTVHLYGRKLG